MAARTYYGLTDTAELEKVINRVVAVLGGGKNAIALLWGTCAAETRLGTVRDIHSKSGYGLCQLDKIAVEDVIARTPDHRKETIQQVFDIDLDTITPECLNHSPILSVIFCRLFYLLIPVEIPDNIIERASYWKRYYNTPKGKGTTDHYLEMSEECCKVDLLLALL